MSVVAWWEWGYVGFQGLQGGSVVGEATWNIVIMGCVKLYCPVSHVLWFMWCAVTGDIVFMYKIVVLNVVLKC